MSDAGSDATEQSSGRSLSDAESVDPDADAGAAAADNDAAAVGVANVDVDIEQGGLDKTASMGQLLETDLDEESERDDTVDELGHFNVVMRSDRRPTRSLTMARDVDRRFERHEFQHNVVMRSKSDVPRRLNRTLSRRESMKLVLRSGSVRAARVASMIVVPSNRIDTDTKVEDWIVNYRCIPPPVFMVIISVFELAVFIGYAIDQHNRGVSTTLSAGVPPHSPLIYQPTRRYEAWRYVTYMFIHNGYVHIVSNLIFQLMIGLPLEMVHGFWRVGPLYIIGVLAGSLATSIVDPWVLLCGASGGCYALLGAQFATITMNWNAMKSGWLKSPMKFLLSGPSQLVFWSILAIINTSVSIYSRFFDAQTAFAAHIAGIISGFLVGLCLLKNFDKKSWKWKLRIVGFGTFGVLISFAIIFNAAYTDYYPRTDWRPCCPSPPSAP